MGALAVGAPRIQNISKPQNSSNYKKFNFDILLV